MVEIAGAASGSSVKNNSMEINAPLKFRILVNFGGSSERSILSRYWIAIGCQSFNSLEQPSQDTKRAFKELTLAGELSLNIKMAEPKFKGYASFSKDEPTNLKLIHFNPKKFEEHDVDIRITHCGVHFA
jgi:hypothetical protein